MSLLNDGFLLLQFGLTNSLSTCVCEKLGNWEYSTCPYSRFLKMYTWGGIIFVFSNHEAGRNLEIEWFTFMLLSWNIDFFCRCFSIYSSQDLLFPFSSTFHHIALLSLFPLVSEYRKREYCRKCIFPVYRTKWVVNLTGIINFMHVWNLTVAYMVHCLHECLLVYISWESSLQPK